MAIHTIASRQAGTAVGDLVRFFMSLTNCILALHFKLFVDQENAKKASFEETEFLYTPLLDANRDRDLIEMMPDYLAEDITFEREVAAKFYARVVKTLTERTTTDEPE